jgi:hypothetical protein
MPPDASRRSTLIERTSSRMTPPSRFRAQFGGFGAQTVGAQTVGDAQRTIMNRTRSNDAEALMQDEAVEPAAVAEPAGHRRWSSESLPRPWTGP